MSDSVTYSSFSHRNCSTTPPFHPDPPPPHQFASVSLPPSLSLYHSPFPSLSVPTASSSESSSAYSRLSASVPVLTQVISFTPDPVTPSRLCDQMDLYNFSQDSLVQHSVQVTTKNNTNDTPHMTLVSPASGNESSKMKDRVKRRDQKLRRLLFSNDSTLQRHRSLVIKELMVGHGHKGCLMTSQPVQKELKKLLRKTMKPKTKGKGRKAPSIAMFRRWVTKRQRSGSTRLVSNPDSGSVNKTCSRGVPVSPSDTSSHATQRGPGTSSDSYLTPRPLTPSRPTPRQPRRITPPSKSSCRRYSCRRRSREDYNFEKERAIHGNSSRRSERRQVAEISSKRDEISRSVRDRVSVSPDTYITIHKSLKRNQKLNRSFMKNQSNSKLRLLRHYSERLRHESLIEGSSYYRRSGRASSVSPSRSLIEHDIHQHSHHRGRGSPRPTSRLERVQRAWREEDIYSLNPFDSWRLRHQPSRYSPPLEHPHGRVSADFGRGKAKQQNGHNRLDTFSADQTPIRQRLRNSWRQERGKSSPAPRLRDQDHEDHETGSSQMTPPVRFSHLLPLSSDVFFRPRPHSDPYSPPHLPGPLDPSQTEASPLVLGWLQVPHDTAEPMKNRVFRKAPWLHSLQFLNR